MGLFAATDQQNYEKIASARDFYYERGGDVAPTRQPTDDCHCLISALYESPGRPYGGGLDILSEAARRYSLDNAGTGDEGLVFWGQNKEWGRRIYDLALEIARERAGINGDDG